MKKLLLVVMVLLILTVLLTAALPVGAKHGGGGGEEGQAGWSNAANDKGNKDGAPWSSTGTGGGSPPE